MRSGIVLRFFDATLMPGASSTNEPETQTPAALPAQDAFAARVGVVDLGTGPFAARVRLVRRTASPSDYRLFLGTRRNRIPVDAR